MNSDSKMGAAKVHSDHGPQTLNARPEDPIVSELLKEEEALPQIASRHGIHPTLLRKWKAQAVAGGSNSWLPSVRKQHGKGFILLEGAKRIPLLHVHIPIREGSFRHPARLVRNWIKRLGFQRHWYLRKEKLDNRSIS